MISNIWKHLFKKIKCVTRIQPDTLLSSGIVVLLFDTHNQVFNVRLYKTAEYKEKNHTYSHFKIIQKDVDLLRLTRN